MIGRFGLKSDVRRGASDKSLSKTISDTDIVAVDLELAKKLLFQNVSRIVGAISLHERIRMTD